MENPRSEIICPRCGGDTDIIAETPVCSDCAWTPEVMSEDEMRKVIKQYIKSIEWEEVTDRERLDILIPRDLPKVILKKGVQ